MPRPWRTTAGQTAARRSPGGKCSRTSAYCTSMSRGGIGFHSLWRVLQAYHDLLWPMGLSPHRILFLRDRVSRTLPLIKHCTVARDADAMTSEVEATETKVCKSLHNEHEWRAKYLKEGKNHKYPSRTPSGWRAITRTC